MDIIQSNSRFLMLPDFSLFLESDGNLKLPDLKLLAELCHNDKYRITGVLFKCQM